MDPDATEPPDGKPVRGPNRQPIVLGHIAGLYGVRGWIKVFSYTEPREALLHYKEWLLATGDAWEPVAVAEGKRHGKALIARFAETDDRDAAARYVGADVAVDRGCLPKPGPGEYYWADLEGLQVRHRDGRVLGQVARMMETGAHDVIVVLIGDDGEREVLIPFVPGVFVLGVDLEAGVIDVDWEWD